MAVKVPMREVLFGAAHLERGRLLWWSGARTGIVSALLVLAFVLGGHAELATGAAIGAIFVAIADAGETLGRRWRTMLWATAWLMFATFVGGISGDWALLGLILTLPIAFFCGFAGAAGPRPAVVGLVTLVIFVIFEGAPESRAGILASTLVVGLGGIIITAVTVVPHLFRWGAFKAALEPMPSVWERVRGNWDLDDNFLRHGIRLAIMVTIAVAISDLTEYPHDYWLPMTVAWVTKPDASGTATRIASRLAGTIAGILVTSLFVNVLSVNDAGVAVLVGSAAAVTVTFIFANYAVAVMGITTVVIGLFSFDGDPVGETIVLRAILTISAAVLAMLGFVIWPSHRRVAHEHAHGLAHPNSRAVVPGEGPTAG